jgi:hypothetical protein
VYFRPALELQKHFGVKYVFVSTDGKGVIEEVLPVPATLRLQPSSLIPHPSTPQAGPSTPRTFGFRAFQRGRSAAAPPRMATPQARCGMRVKAREKFPQFTILAVDNQYRFGAEASNMSTGGDW